MPVCCVCGCTSVHSVLMRPRHSSRHIVYTVHIQSYSTHMQAKCSTCTTNREMKYHFSTFNSPFFRHARFERLESALCIRSAFDAFVSCTAHLCQSTHQAQYSQSMKIVFNLLGTHTHTQTRLVIDLDPQVMTFILFFLLDFCCCCCCWFHSPLLVFAFT